MCFSLISTNHRCHKKTIFSKLPEHVHTQRRHCWTCLGWWTAHCALSRPTACTEPSAWFEFAFLLSLIIGLKIDSSKHLRRFWQSSSANLEIRGKSNSEWHLLVWPLCLRLPHPCLRTAGNDNLTLKKWWLVKSWFNILLHSCDKGVWLTLMMSEAAILSWNGVMFEAGY